MSEIATDVSNDLKFRRFGKEKQEQIRQLVVYATMMNLSGKDLISIGGVLDRRGAANEYKVRVAIVKAFDVEPVNPKTYRDEKLRDFYLTHNGQRYHCERGVRGKSSGKKLSHDSTREWCITNVANQRGIMYKVGYQRWGARNEAFRYYATLLFDIHNNLVKLP